MIIEQFIHDHIREDESLIFAAQMQWGDFLIDTVHLGHMWAKRLTQNELPEYLLRMTEASRSIAADHGGHRDAGDVPCETLRALARVWIHADDFDSSWA